MNRKIVKRIAWARLFSPMGNRAEVHFLASLERRGRGEKGTVYFFLVHRFLLNMLFALYCTLLVVPWVPSPTDLKIFPRLIHSPHCRHSSPFAALVSWELFIHQVTSRVCKRDTCSHRVASFRLKNNYFIIRLVIQFVFIINLVEDINVHTVYYKTDQS